MTKQSIETLFWTVLFSTIGFFFSVLVLAFILKGFLI